jgi:hypothetical protein
MSDTTVLHLYGTTGDFRKHGFLTWWFVRLPGVHGCRVIRDEWATDDKGRPIRQVFAYEDGATGELVGKP